MLGWDNSPAVLAGIALAATSVAVVYTVMMEYGFNRVEYGKTILAACFITDLGTVVTLGLVFAPFTWKTLLFVAVLAAAFVGLPKITPRAYALFGGKPSEFEAKFLLFCLMALGALAVWAGSEAVLLPTPYYHVVFTLPAAIGDVAYQNKAVIYDLLFKASVETMITIATDPKHLGARIGVTSVLHTWGSALPTIRTSTCRSGRGISLDGQRWVSCRRASSCRCACSRGCSPGCFWKSSSPPMPPGACNSLARTQTSRTAMPSRNI